MRQARRPAGRRAPGICGILATGEGPCQHQTAAAQTRPRAAIAAALGQIGFTLPGSITIRRTRCGKPRCACAADPPSRHGPCIQWTRTVKGKTVTRLLTPAQYQACAPWFASARRLRALAAELEAPSLAEMARDRAGPRSPPARRHRPAPNSPGYPETAPNTQNTGRPAR